MEGRRHQTLLSIQGIPEELLCTPCPEILEAMGLPRCTVGMVQNNLGQIPAAGPFRWQEN